MQKIYKKPLKNKKTIILLFSLNLIFFILIKYYFNREGSDCDMIKASEVMLRAMETIKNCRKVKEIPSNENVDINKTGLIGIKYSSITTSIGNLEAKRTTTNPNFAGLIVLLLKQAGIKKGDTIAVGASGSFPALIIAVLSASKVMNLKPLIIFSIGASQWGANIPEFNMLDILDCLLKKKIFDVKPVAVSLGGEKDIGENMNFKIWNLISEKIKESGIYFIYEPVLRKNVKIRMHLYKKEARENEIKVFINIGGNWANMGEDPEILKLKPGIVKIKEFPPIEKRGIIHEMAQNKIPIIHLLNIRGLIEKYELPWDPTPLPKSGEGRIYKIAKIRRPSFLIITAIYLLFIILTLIFRNKVK